MSYQRALTMCEHVTSLGSESIQITAMLGVMKLILAYLIDVVKAIILIILLTFISASLIPTISIEPACFKTETEDVCFA